MLPRHAAHEARRIVRPNACQVLAGEIIGKHVLITNHNKWPAERSNPAPPIAVTSQSIVSTCTPTVDMSRRKGFGWGQPPRFQEHFTRKVRPGSGTFLLSCIGPSRLAASMAVHEGTFTGHLLTAASTPWL